MTEEEGQQRNSRMNWIARLPFQHINVFFGSTGAFGAGVVLGWSSFGGWMLRASIGWEPRDADLVVGIVAAGACLGALLSMLALVGFRARKLAYASVMLFVHGWLLVCQADRPHEYTMLMIGRVLLGVGVGLFNTILPVFIGEIASPQSRDRLLYYMHVMLSCGIVASYALVDTEAEHLNRYSIYCALTCIPMIFCAEPMNLNPVESMANGEVQSARRDLVLYNWAKEDDVNRRMDELRELVRKDRSSKSKADCHFWTLLALTICHHLSGSLSVIFNALTLVDFAGSGPTLNSSQLCLVCSVCQVMASSVGLLIVPKLGRRILLTVSALMMATFMGLLGWTLNEMQNNEEFSEIYCWASPTLVALYFSAYGLGFGPITWAMLADSFPMEMRYFSASVIGASGWLVSLLLNLYLGFLLETLGVGNLLWLFVGFSLLGALLGSCFVRETRGKSLIDLQR